MLFVSHAVAVIGVFSCGARRCIADLLQPWPCRWEPPGLNTRDSSAGTSFSPDPRREAGPDLARPSVCLPVQCSCPRPQARPVSVPHPLTVVPSQQLGPVRPAHPPTAPTVLSTPRSRPRAVLSRSFPSSHVSGQLTSVVLVWPTASPSQASGDSPQGHGLPVVPLTGRFLVLFTESFSTVRVLVIHLFINPLSPGLLEHRCPGLRLGGGSICPLP